MNPDSNFPEPILWQFEEVLDLHTFKPSEVGGLVSDYLDHSKSKGWRTVRIIHGKGIGNLRRTVESVLRRHQDVESFRLAPTELGGWGATLVHLKATEYKAAFWLVPSADYESILAPRILELAERFSSVPFLPHLTLWSGEWNPGQNQVALEKLKRSRPLQLFVEGFDSSELFTRTFFIRFQKQPELLALFEQLNTGGEKTTDGFDPHLSLLYAALTADQRAGLLKEKPVPFLACLFERLAWVRISPKISQPSDVSDFKICQLAHFQG
ncbi:MAG: Smr protein/MutS2 [Verrucomicrobiales bacterium]|nr:Smr protein/MutS2 [Verrucomicrobiales bacterium]